MSTITFTISQGEGGFVSTPASQTATQKNPTITFVMSGKVASKFTFTGYTSNDSKQQLGSASFSADNRTMTIPNSNTEAETITITAQISDGQTEGSYGSIAEVTNDPPH